MNSPWRCNWSDWRAQVLLVDIHFQIEFDLTDWEICLFLFLDIRQYEFQLRTCKDLFPRNVKPPWCPNPSRDGKVEVAFELQQISTSLFLNEFRCVCPQNRSAEILEITYKTAISPDHRSIQPRFISMGCWTPVSSCMNSKQIFDLMVNIYFKHHSKVFYIPLS